MSCINHYSKIKNSFTSQSLPHTEPLAITDLFNLSVALLFLECHIIGVCSLFRLVSLI